MSMEIPGLPETSLNAGIMKMTEEEFSVSFSVRSSVKSRKEEVMDRLSYLSEFLGGTVTFTGNYPAWEYKKDSKVRELVLDVYRDLYQKEPKIEAIHAGLECGILSEKRLKIWTVFHSDRITLTSIHQKKDFRSLLPSVYGNSF